MNKYINTLLFISVFSISILLFVYINNSNKEVKVELRDFDNSDVYGEIEYIDHGAGGYHIRTSDHGSTNFSFSIIPDGKQPKLSFVLNVGDSIIKAKNSERLIIKNSDEITYEYKLNRWFIE